MMPTNRTRRTRKIARSALSDAWKYFLETGDYCLRKKFPESRDRVEIFRLANPSGAIRLRLKKVWIEHRPEVLADWKKQKRRGLPWAAKEFKNE